MSKTPQLVVLAGPNGAGKSTSAPSLIAETLGITDFVNADVIAQGLSAFGRERDSVAMEAGRIMLRRLDELGRFRLRDDLGESIVCATDRRIEAVGLSISLGFSLVAQPGFGGSTSLPQSQ